MGFRDDFYIADNIIGWTGRLHDNPTVYFEHKPGNGMMEFGHITQFHGDRDNIGRGDVNLCAEGAYSIDNYWTQADGGALALRSVESSLDGYYHPSRNPFQSSESLAAESKAILALAIRNHTEVKPKVPIKGVKYLFRQHGA